MKKYKISVLSDLEGKADATLKSAIGLAKIIKGEIEVFAVKKASEIIEGTNQLSAMRSINDTLTASRNKMKRTIDPIAKQYGITIDHSLAIGNVKTKIGEYIDAKKPDIIVLGKKKGKILNLTGDNITSYLLNKFKGTILIANNNTVIEPGKELSLGLFDSLGTEFDRGFAKDLMAHTQQPLKSFKIAKASNSPKMQKQVSDRKIVEYVFEQNDTAIEAVSNYLVKNNIDVLYVDRVKKTASPQANTLRPDMQKIIDKVDVTLLVPGEEHQDL